MYATATVKQVLDRKGRDVWSVSPEMTVLEALAYMAEKNIGAVVVREGENLVGIFSERDYARKVVLEGKTEKETSIRDVMTSKVIGVNPHNTIDECLALMTGKFIRHLPVVGADGTVNGVISIGDVVKETIAEQMFMIDQLVQYVSGEMPEPLVPEKSQIQPGE